ncbi:MAG: acyl-CoA dehydrogenase family protein [Syntrophobacterales bacterium]|nr:acyl-CoA dehydrogenase family protein [Syntrophobacterales bacterium]
MGTRLMDQILRGKFDEGIFNSYEEKIRWDLVNTIIEDYQRLLETSSSEELEKRGKLTKKVLKDMASIGLFGLNIPETYGGRGLNLQEYLTVVAEMAKIDLSISLVSLAHLSIGIKGILLFGSREQKERYLPKAASGDLIFSYALTEPKHGSDARHIETRVELAPDGQYYILNGKKTYITNANYAGAFTVFAQMDPDRPGFMGAFIVETGWEGVSIEKDMPKMGLKASSTAAVTFENVKVPKENLIGDPGDGYKIALAILSYGRLGLAAASFGLMRQSLKDMIKRARSRVQFGRNIIDFELVQEMIVKAKVYAAVTRAMTFFTSYILEKDPGASVAVETSHCKLFGTTRAWDVLYNALQIHGGAGYLSTLPFEKRMRDFRVATIFEGTTEIHSIYPPLWILRQWKKDLSKESLVEKAKNIGSLLAIHDKWESWGEELEFQRAQRVCNKLVTSARMLLTFAMLRYGDRVSEQEFFLRRITSLSLYAFGLIALGAVLKYKKRQRTLREEDLAILEYFTEEARLIQKSTSSILPSPIEKAHARVMEAISTGESRDEV